MLLRVNSPGGSAVASDTIWREVVRLRAAGKPVVVSMSDVAASGGYYISMAADVIVAQPGTLTGSIGVIIGKPVLRKPWGGSASPPIRWPRAPGPACSRPPIRSRRTSGNGSTPGSTRSTPSSWKAAEGRRMPVERMHELARGRVWTGADAAANGLVDELGGMADAAEIARRRAGLPAARVGAAGPGSPRSTSCGRPSPASPARGRGRLDFGRPAGTGWGPAWRLAARAGLPRTDR